MAQEVTYLANTGYTTISTPNSSLTGSGTLGTVISASADGTMIKSVIIKAQGDTSPGMVRLFISDGGNNQLIQEIQVPDNRVSSTGISFCAIIPMNYCLKSGSTLMASTENGDTFNIIAFGMDWSFTSGKIRDDRSIYVAATSGATLSVANPYLDGSGTIETVLTAGLNGCKISNIILKGQSSSSLGMIRLFIFDGGAGQPILFWESPVSEIFCSATEPSFFAEIMNDELFLMNGYSIMASTEISDRFTIMVEGMNWYYP
jgi:hypothetical protein